VRLIVRQRPQHVPLGNWVDMGASLVTTSKQITSQRQARFFHRCATVLTSGSYFPEFCDSENPFMAINTSPANVQGIFWQNRFSKMDRMACSCNSGTLTRSSGTTCSPKSLLLSYQRNSENGNW
jgi:hypothetical protein